MTTDRDDFVPRGEPRNYICRPCKKVWPVIRRPIDTKEFEPCPKCGKPSPQNYSDKRFGLSGLPTTTAGSPYKRTARAGGKKGIR